MTARFRILVTDKLAPEGLDVLRSADPFEVVEAPELAKDPDALRAALRDADGIAVRSGTQLTAEILEGQERLRAIVRAGVGIDNIDVKAATRRGIVVMNTPGGNTISTAELTIALLLSLVRHTPKAHASLIEGRWERSQLSGTQLAGKTIAVIGLGRVGQAVATRALAFEMTVLGYDPFLSSERASELGIELVADLNDLWVRADVITLHVPLTNETRNLIGAEQIAKMRPNVRIINCARGGLIDEQALCEALDDGKVAGAAFDVFDPEPPPADHPLIGHPKVVVTPHLGASTKEAQVNVAVEAARLLTDYLVHGKVRFAANMAALDQAQLDDLRSYIDLTRRLGMLHAQMDRGAVKSVTLNYRGEVAGRDTHLLTSSFAAGWLESALEEQVNLVNAPVLARERGVHITETTSRDTIDFGTLIATEVETDSKSYTASGTLFGDRYLRLVRLGPYRLDAHLDGTLLIFTHRDRPGLIGQIGTLLGQHDVNIAQMNVGREAPGGEAIAVLNIDSVPSPEALEAVRACPDLKSLSVIELPPIDSLPSWLSS